VLSAKTDRFLWMSMLSSTSRIENIDCCSYEFSGINIVMIVNGMLQTSPCTCDFA
jgi:hypothetical protein